MPATHSSAPAGSPPCEPLPARPSPASHVWGGGYDAGYYAYAWTAVLAADSAAWFAEHGGMTAANGAKFRDLILSKGSTKDAHQLYLDFRGREPSAKALLVQRGLQ